MTSEWEGTSWGGSSVPIAKAESGIGALMLQYGTPYLIGAGMRPHELMRRAQMAYHVNPWIRLAESTVTRRVVGLPWHLEDDDEAEDEADTGLIAEVRTLIERPQMRLDKRQPAVALRRGLWSLTSRHVGLCGISHWYLDQREAMTGLPLGFLYINPARMYPMEDDAGNLLAWSLDPTGFDAHGRPLGGMTLTLSEVQTFYLDPPDAGNLGHGLYEAAVLKAQITNLADQHAAYVLGTGGRIAGMISPKEGTIQPQQMKDLERDLRNVTDATDAAKRLTILSGPVDWHPTAADPSDLSLVELSKMNRDDILALWGVPPATAGIPAPAGLNSGGTREYDEAILMQGSVHERVESIRESLQFGLLDGLGSPVDLVIEEPEFDDRVPQFEMASKARELPLTNRERRELIGLPPFGENGKEDPRDLEVWLPSTLTVAYEADGSVPAPPPAPVFPPPQVEPVEDDMPGKAASRRAVMGLRTKTETRWVPNLSRDIRKVLEEQRGAVIAKLRKSSDESLKRHRSDPDYWFPAKRGSDPLAAVLERAAAGIAESVVEGTGAMFGRKAEAFVESVASRLRAETGSRVVGINETTREIIARSISQGFDLGLSPMQIAQGLEDGASFSGLGDESILARAERIARTETAFAYNSAAIASYREYGVEQVEAIDGDEDELCAARNGKPFSLDEAMTIQDHPNGTLDWMPIVGKADLFVSAPPVAKAPLGPSLRIDVGEPPIVNVPAPVVNVEAPVVHVDTRPFTDALARLEQSLVARPVVKTVERNAAGTDHPHHGGT